MTKATRRGYVPTDEKEFKGDNLNKLYNYDYSKKDNTYEIYNLQYKIEDDTGDMCRYNASINKLDCGSYNDKCYVKKTNIGDREYINISCDDYE